MVALIAILILSVYSNMHELAINEHSRAGRASPASSPQEPTAEPHQARNTGAPAPHQARRISAANPQRATSGKNTSRSAVLFYQLTHILMLKLKSSVLS